MLTSGSLLLEEIDGDPLIFLPHLRKAEEGIAAKIKQLATAAPVYPRIDFEKAVAWCEQRIERALAPSQREALKTVLTNRAAIITGGPGVGKTTLVNSTLMILRAKRVKCLVCAPTGRAAKRLTETTGLEAKTIHRLLKSIRQREGSCAMRISRSAICLLSMRHPWWTSWSCTLCSRASVVRFVRKGETRN
jgi:exodeoxyribonuclease V alpha subunit